jgi:hypothetical protein
MAHGSISMFALSTVSTIGFWLLCALLAVGVFWSRFEKKKTRDKLLSELMAMDPERREKVLSRLRPQLEMEIRQQMMERFRE